MATENESALLSETQQSPVVVPEFWHIDEAQCLVQQVRGMVDLIRVASKTDDADRESIPFVCFAADTALRRLEALIIDGAGK